MFKTIVNTYYLASISLLRCDTEKYLRGEPLKVSPSFIDANGFQPLTFQGPCFNTSALVACIFHDPGKVRRLLKTEHMLRKTIIVNWALNYVHCSIFYSLILLKLRKLRLFK